MQTAGVPENSTWQRDRRSSDRCQPTIWKIGLHSVHLLGQKCQICICFSGGWSRPDLGQDPEPGIREKNQRGRDTEADRIRDFCEQTGICGLTIKMNNDMIEKIKCLFKMFFINLGRGCIFYQ